jgi:hypothetical protein
MTEDQMFEKLSKIFSRKQLTAVEEYVIYKTDDNEYGLYGEYTIKKEGNSFIMTKIFTHTVRSFASLRNAVIWTSLDKRNHIVDAQRVAELDTMLYGVDASLEVHKRLAEKAKNLDTRLNFLTKLQEDKIKKNQITKELNDFAKNTDNWQYKKFSEVLK